MAQTKCAEFVSNFNKQLTTLSQDVLKLPRQSTYKDTTKHYDRHEPSTVTENQAATILWDMPIQTDKEIQANTQDIHSGER